ncbi:uncharacterized protein LOC119735446 [Patiria miniata]|uniref:Protein sleepless n=1 Tax=Patiria miniata TaxID=46514 RepID=A0A914AMV4_PATMI|nr:uncharacterized protein LOC119735446 [Patiria miniata]
MEVGVSINELSAGVFVTRCLLRERDLRSGMGTSLIWIVASVALICDQGAALKCYECVDVYDTKQESNENCRSNTEALTAEECQRPNGTEPEATPRCMKEVGTVTIEPDTGGAVQEQDVLRSCIWLLPDAPENQCFNAPSEDQPLEEISVVEAHRTDIFDVYALCVCNTDSCNGVGALQSSFAPLVSALASAALLAILRSP